MADIFHEVEEDLRRDQAAAIWKKYGNLLVGAALLLVLAVAAHWGWTKYATNQQMQASSDFLSAASTSDVKAREAALGKIAAEGGIYGVLARLRAETRRRPAASWARSPTTETPTKRCATLR